MANTRLSADGLVRWIYDELPVTWTFDGSTVEWRGSGEVVVVQVTVPSSEPDYGIAADFVLYGVWDDEDLDGVF